MNRLFVAPSLLILVSIATASAGDGGSVPSEYEKSIARFHAKVGELRAKKDVKGLQKLAAEIKAEWMPKKNAAYYPVILEVCVAMNSLRTTEPGIDESIRDLAVAAIDSPGEKLAYSTTRLLLFLLGDPDYSTGQLAGEKWTAERKIRAERFLKVWKIVREANAAFPAPVGEIQISVNDGIVPKDPAARAIYDAEVARNHQLAEAHNKKRMLKDAEEDAVIDTQRYLTEAYSKPPFRTKELADILNRHNFGKNGEPILKEVNRREAAEKERAAAEAKFIADNGTGMNAKKLQYSTDGSTFRDAASTIFVATGDSLTFKSPFGNEPCTWKGPSGTIAKGTQIEVKFSELSRSLTHFKTVTATRGADTISARVIVYDFEPVLIPRDNFPGRDLDAYGVYEFIHLSFKTMPAGIREDEIGGLQWVIKTPGEEDLYGAGGIATYQCGGAGGKVSLVLQNVQKGNSDSGPAK